MVCCCVCVGFFFCFFFGNKVREVFSLSCIAVCVVCMLGCSTNTEQAAVLLLFHGKVFFFFSLLKCFISVQQIAKNSSALKQLQWTKKWHSLLCAEIANKQCRYSAIVPFVCGSGEVEQLLLKYIERRESRNILLCADFSLQLCAYFSSLTVQICLGWQHRDLSLWASQCIQIKSILKPKLA